MSKVYIKKITQNNIEDKIKEFLSGINFTPRKNHVFIKPNICGFYKSASPCIVNPRVVAGVIEYLKDKGISDIVLGELPIPQDARGVFEKTGYAYLGRKYRVSLLDLSRVEREEIKLKNFSITVPKFVTQGEYEYINIAKFKTHILTQVSLCTKNQKGLLDSWGRKLMHIEGDLHENIKLLGHKIKPDFCMIEGLNALEGNGPGRLGREVKKFNVIIAGNSMEDVDWVGAQVMGIDPQSVKHLLPVGNNIEVLGDSIRGVKRNFTLAGNTYCFQKLNIHFWMTDKTCSGCSEIMKELRSSLSKSPLSLIKFSYHAIFGRIDILTGGAAIPPGVHSKVVCLGNCMAQKAREYNLPLLEGCPATLKGLTEIF